MKKGKSIIGEIVEVSAVTIPDGSILLGRLQEIQGNIAFLSECCFWDEGKVGVRDYMEYAAVAFTTIFQPNGHEFMAYRCIEDIKHAE